MLYVVEDLSAGIYITSLFDSKNLTISKNSEYFISVFENAVIILKEPSFNLETFLSLYDSTIFNIMSFLTDDFIVFIPHHRLSFEMRKVRFSFDFLTDYNTLVINLPFLHHFLKE
nr:MAG TPA: hypothetical protein [Caudoviricetes sp.]